MVDDMTRYRDRETGEVVQVYRKSRHQWTVHVRGDFRGQVLSTSELNARFEPVEDDD